MPDIHKVSVALTGDQLTALKKAVAAGEYATTSEIVREAIRDWQLKREIGHEQLKRLRAFWAEGEASGPARPVNIAALKRAARARLTKRRKTSRDAS